MTLERSPTNTPLQGVGDCPVRVKVDEEQGEVENIDGHEHHQGDQDQGKPGVGLPGLFVVNRVDHSVA